MIAMTMMVRDEADIVGAMIEHHLSQGVDLFIVTDNGSVDGTTEILEQFAREGRIELRHDPRHAKQQHAVVTRMSRDAAARGARWVLNADADEFWVSKDAKLTIAQELSLIDPAIGAFPVAVTDMIGAPAARGTGLQRLTYRDHRPVDVIRALGIHAHATDDVAFAATEDVVVAQGNHFVNIEPTTTLPPDRGLKVYHFPWRSWEQFDRKVSNTGRAYEASPHLRPSANHHGMRDYRRWKDGTLESSYVARHPSPDELRDGVKRGWLIEDRRIADLVTSPVADVRIPDEEIDRFRAISSLLQPMETRMAALEGDLRQAKDDLDFRLRHVTELDELVARLREELGREQNRTALLGLELADAKDRLARFENLLPVRAARRLRAAWSRR